MKKIFNGFVLLFPYLYVVLTYFIVNLENPFLPFVFTTATMIILFVVSIIMTVIDVISKWELKTSLFYNLWLKIVYVPVHIALLLIMGGMGNPFLFLFMGIPFGISCMLMGITGVFATIVFVKDRKLSYSVGKVVLYSVLSYCYVADLVVAVIGYRDSLRCENCKQKDFERE